MCDWASVKEKALWETESYNRNQTVRADSTAVCSVTCETVYIVACFFHLLALTYIRCTACEAS